jgi:hypothetical protein
MIKVGKVIAQNGLRLRKRPDVHSEVEATLPFGTVVDLDAAEGNWWRVKYKGTDGYLYKDYVEVLKVSPPDLDPPYDPPEQSWNKTIVGLVVAIIAAIMAFVWWH